MYESSQARGRIGAAPHHTYTTATATWDLSRICDLHHSSRQCCRILNPLSKARDQPTSSWVLVGFLTAEPLWELPFSSFLPFFFFLSRATSLAYGSSQARGWIGVAPAGLGHSHSNMGSEPHLWPTPQLRATLDPWPAEWGQGWNTHPHGY